jgi:hypothetical protein
MDDESARPGGEANIEGASAGSEQVKGREVAPVQAGPVGRTAPWPPESTVLTLQDLIDLPRQILPEETYRHLRNAGREALLAVFSLVSSMNKSTQGSGKVRKHIDVE